MKRFFTSLPLWLIACLATVFLSVRADIDSAAHSNLSAWLWFQRSGSFLVLAGAVLSYRSVVRLGIHGVGGVNTTMIMGKVESVDDTGPSQKVRLSLDEDTKKFLHEAAVDRLCGYVGALLLVIGTLIWGYGDLLGSVFK